MREGSKQSLNWNEMEELAQARSDEFGRSLAEFERDRLEPAAEGGGGLARRFVDALVSLSVSSDPDAYEPDRDAILLEGRLSAYLR
jgi:hypothetical protein